MERRTEPSGIVGVVGIDVQAADSPGDVLTNVKSSLDLGILKTTE